MAARVALVSGADRGLGRAIVQQLLTEGWTVLAGQFLPWPELDELAKNNPQSLHLLPLDVGSSESVRTAFLLASSLVDHVDLLIANAAINRSAHIDSIREEVSFEDMQEEYNINTLGALRLTKEFLPLTDKSEMKRLCYVSSEAGSIGASERTGWFGYCMSKAALNMAVKNLDNDLSSQGYQCRVYQPGWMRTYMSGTKNVEADMEPEEAARLALKWFLAQEAPGHLTLRTFDGQDMPW